MNNTVYSTLLDKCGFCETDRIIVALSGGADSVTLLDVLYNLREKFGHFELYAAHINHNLRGEESDRDEAFVRRLCKDLGVELFVLSEDVGSLAKAKGQSIELCAREVRYAFFEKLSKELSAKVATAHTLSDSIETMIYNICRGTSLRGLCSIPYKRDYIIRPMLDVTREQVEEYCRTNNLTYVNDSTNSDKEMCKRNKIRLSVLPLLKEINGGLDLNFYRLRENLIFADDYITDEATKAIASAKCDFGYDSEVLANLHPSVKSCALAILIRNADISPDSVHIKICEDILAKNGAVQLSDEVFAVCKQGVFRITKSKTDDCDFEIPFRCDEEFEYNGKMYSIKKYDKNLIVNKKLSSLCIGYDKIDDSIVIRKRRAGDTFTLINRSVTKPLRKLQNELKIPAEKRDDALVLARGSVVLWAEYIGVSAQGALTDDAQGIVIDTNEI